MPKKINPFIIALLAISICLYGMQFAAAQASSSPVTLQVADSALKQAFEQVLNAENAGANVTELLIKLNSAEESLAYAQSSYRSEDSTINSSQTNKIIQIAQEVKIDAEGAKQDAIAASENAFVLTLTFTIVGSVVFVEAVFLSWRSYKHRLSKRPPYKANERLKLFFISVGLIGLLLFASPTIALFIETSGETPITQLYILGPSMTPTNYPSKIDIGQNYSFYANLENNLGESGYYILYVRLTNSTDNLPKDSSDVSHQIEPLYEYRFSLQSNHNWQNLMTFSISSGSKTGNESLINVININDLAYRVEKSSTLGSSNDKFAYHLLFDLWRYNFATNSFQYDNRCVSLGLNLDV
jgi:hypothetical protein